jgi:hypothetical protein
MSDVLTKFTRIVNITNFAATTYGASDRCRNTLDVASFALAYESHSEFRTQLTDIDNGGSLVLLRCSCNLHR